MVIRTYNSHTMNENPAKSDLEALTGTSMFTPEERAAQAAQIDQMQQEIDSRLDGAVSLGPYNVATNTPALTADASAVAAGSYYEVVVGGSTPFSGNNFTAATVWAVGDKIKKINSQWYRVAFIIPDKSVDQAKLAPGLVVAKEARGNTEDLEFIIATSAGEVLFGIRADGTISNPQVATIVGQLLALPGIQSSLAFLQGISPISVRGNIQDVEYAITSAAGELLFGIRADGTVVNSQIEGLAANIAAIPVLQSDLTSLQAKSALSVRGNISDVEYAIASAAGELLFGIRADGMIVNPHIQSLSDKVDVLGGSYLDVVPVHGQSNSNGAVNHCQEWRTPMVWGEYPAGYTGELDGNIRITPLPAPSGAFTLNSDLSAIVPITSVPYGMEEGISRGMLDSILTHYPDRKICLYSHGVGGKNILYLDKPTPTQINAGSADGLPIPNTSGEYLLQAAGKGIASILDYAFSTYVTPYYRGMYMLARTVLMAKVQGMRVRVPAMCWIQGESDATRADYEARMLQLYDDYNRDVQILTGQVDRMVMLIEESNYSTQLDQPGQAGYDAYAANNFAAAYGIGGANSLYLPENQRVNTNIILNQNQLQAMVDGPYASPTRRIVMVSPRYPISLRIHMHPHASRQHGEQFGKVFRKVIVEKKDFFPLYPISWWISGTDIWIRFNVPKAPIRFELPPMLSQHTISAGKAYGFEHSAGGIQEANVKIVGPDLIRITPDVAPAAGQTIGYVQNVKAGSLCDSDPTPGMYANRAGQNYLLRNYCLPFSITL